MNQPNKQTKQARRALDKEIKVGDSSLLDVISPSAFAVTPNYIQLNNIYAMSFFVFTYPRYLNTNWLSPIINYGATMDISMFIHPIKTAEVMGQLRRKQTQLESTLAMQREKGQVRDPELETAISDIDSMHETLQQGSSKLFHLALYFTIYEQTLEKLHNLAKQIESTLGGMLVYAKPATLQMEQGFISSAPQMIDEMNVLRNLDTASLSTAFPFASATLTSNRGILYGINRHNNSLVLFDRFDLENANSVVFARSGSGKSYAVKLEVLRYLMLGTDVIVVDPENEYKALAEAVGGSWISLSLNSPKRINPFDLPLATQGQSGESVLRGTIAMLEGLIGLMVGGLTPDESGILDKALIETYALKDITADPSTHKNPPPLLGDLLSVLANMSGAESLGKRLSKYVEGTFAGLFTKPTNFNLENGMVVFSIRDLEETLRPIGMYLILSYVWSKIRHSLRRRLLILDEAWVMMQHEDSAKFVHSIAKRARKYYLGLTVISQDVEDFLTSQYGRAVISNAAMMLLLKQSTTALDQLGQVFNLTEAEKFLLQEAEVGEGIFFAGRNHIAMKIIASYTEDQIITTDPRQLLSLQDQEGEPPTGK